MHPGGEEISRWGVAGIWMGSRDGDTEGREKKCKSKRVEECKGLRVSVLGWPDSLRWCHDPSAPARKRRGAPVGMTIWVGRECGAAVEMTVF